MGKFSVQVVGEFHTHTLYHKREPVTDPELAVEVANEIFGANGWRNVHDGEVTIENPHLKGD